MNACVSHCGHCGDHDGDVCWFLNQSWIYVVDDDEDYENDDDACDLSNDDHDHAYLDDHDRCVYDVSHYSPDRLQTKHLSVEVYLRIEHVWFVGLAVVSRRR